MSAASEYNVRILKDASKENLWHWIVECQSGKELFGMGQEPTKEAAQKAAEDCTARLNRSTAIRKWLASG